MAAPTLQAEGAITIATTTAVAPTVPAHVADDILVASVVAWVPATVAVAGTIPTPANWNEIAQVGFPSDGAADGWVGLFWCRATGSGTTVSFARNTQPWDTGTDSAYGAVVDVIRGCITTGTPYDAANESAVYTTANQNTPAITVSGADRLVYISGLNTQDSATALFTALTGFTMGTSTNRASTTGTGAQARSARLATSSNHSATATTHTAPTAGRHYAFIGASFKPPAVATLERSAAISGATAIASVATFFSIESRATDLSAAGAIASAGQVEHVHSRAAALSATTSIASAGIEVLERASALSATAALASAPQRDLLRAASLAGTTGIASAGEVIPAGPATYERSASLAATTGIASAGTFWSILERAVGITATAAVISVGQRDFLRSAAIGASGQIAAAYRRDLLRSSLLAAVGNIASAGFRVGGPQTLERSAFLAAATAVSSTGQRDLLRAVVMVAVANIASAGQVHIAQTHERAALLAAVGLIASRGELAALQWPGSTDDRWPGDDDVRWPGDDDDRWAGDDDTRWPALTESRW